MKVGAVVCWSRRYGLILDGVVGGGEFGAGLYPCTVR